MNVRRSVSNENARHIAYKCVAFGQLASLLCFHCMSVVLQAPAASTLQQTAEIGCLVLGAGTLAATFSAKHFKYDHDQ